MQLQHLAVMAATPVSDTALTRRSTGEATDWLLLSIPGTIWGASFLFIAEALEAVGPFGVTFGRIAIGFATLACVPSARRPVARADWPLIAVLGVIWLAFPLSMFPFAEQRVSSALTGMLNGAGPVITALVTVAFVRQLPSRRVVLGLAVGLGGTALVALPALNEGRSSVDGVLLILIALISYGFALNVGMPLQSHYGAVPVVWRAQAVALLCTAPMGVREVVAATWTPPAALSLILLGALGTGLAYVVIGKAATRLGPTRASATAFLIPPVALVLGIVVRDEHVAVLSIAGAVVCAAGAWLIRRSGRD